MDINDNIGELKKIRDFINGFSSGNNPYKKKKKWTYPPEKEIVRKVLNNKNLFVGYELDYMDNNSKISIKDRDGFINPNDFDDYESMIEKKIKKEYKKWIKKSPEKKEYDPVKQTPSDPTKKTPNRQRTIPMTPGDNRVRPMTDDSDRVEPMITEPNVDPRFFEDND